ncbi:hypothetical protein HRbin40_01087 [bacterium HR40]|nr:hypothetical protein HRbin40_01087 [bacterium HR40]
MVKPQLPSAYDLVVLEGERDPVARACALARDRGSDGTLVWADRPDRLSLALLLEPDADLRTTALDWHTFTVAAQDALAGLTLAAYPLHFRFPNRVLFDGCELARLRCVWPRRTAPCERPAWIVFGLEAEMQEPAEPGAQPERMTLAGAGAEAPPVAFVEAIARQFLYWLQRRDAVGFEGVRRIWNHRLERRGELGSLRLGGIEAAGVIEGLDAEGLFRIGGQAIGLWDIPEEILA